MRILITAGPTREYLDDVRYLTNASSGRMGYALTEAAIAAGHEVVLVSGPVELLPPMNCDFHRVETTEEMHEQCMALFAGCNGVIAAAAVCDYKPLKRTSGKIRKTGHSLVLELVETVDVLADLGRQKGDRWIIGFALESENARENALRKLREKNCDAIALNEPSAIGAESNTIELIDAIGRTVAIWNGSKRDLAHSLIDWINAHFHQG